MVQSQALHKLQNKIIPPTILQSCPNGSIGEGVFVRCHKAFLQGTVACVKEYKGHTQSSKSSLLQEAEMLSTMFHPSLCWLVALQIHTVPFQLVLPYYAVEGTPVTYHDVLFNRDKLQPSILQIYTVWSWCTETLSLTTLVYIKLVIAGFVLSLYRLWKMLARKQLHYLLLARQGTSDIPPVTSTNSSGCCGWCIQTIHS